MARRPLTSLMGWSRPTFEEKHTTIYCPRPQLTAEDWQQALEDLDTGLRDKNGYNYIRLVGAVGHIAIVRLRHKVTDG